MSDADRFSWPTVGRRNFLRQSVALGLGAGVLAANGARALAEALEDVDAASAALQGDDLVLTGSGLEARWSIAGGRLRPGTLTILGDRLALGDEAFVFTLDDGTPLPASAFRIVGAPRVMTLAPDPRASRAADRVGGRAVGVELEDADGRARVEWRALLGDGSRYLRQEMVVRALKGPLAVREIVLLDLAAPGARIAGTVKGSPVVARDWFLGFEHPLSAQTVDGARVRTFLARELPLRPESPVTVSSVIGRSRPGQMRRDFLSYVERERAHPYRPFLHYNSWYDIGYFSKYSEPEALAVVETFGNELVRKRGVTLSSFLFDDGWDDPRTLWGFHAGFPDGFTRLRAAAARYGAAPGVWMSPWGGYGQPKKDRLEFGTQQGFETNEGGFALSGPKYFARFRDTCQLMIRRYGINQFKIDGTGNANRAFPGSAFDSDFDAAISLIGELRREKPDLFVNLTTGTYPSPFWLRWADSTWRGGEDHSFAGTGSDRQQWITYRDGTVHTSVVGRGELYPLNSLMLHGVIYARKAQKLDKDPQGDLRSEVRSYFGSGTQLQELYVTPQLTAAEWDVIAESANWARTNAATLVDTHWIGGDPLQLEPYGWGAWSDRKGIVTLRNPSDQPRRFGLDVRTALELPDLSPVQWRARSLWASDRAQAAQSLRAGTEQSIALAPFEVRTLELTPSS